MPAPTFITSSPGASWDTTTSPKTSGALATQIGDLVVSVLSDENDDGTENFAWTSSVAETWTEHAESVGTTNADVFQQSARCVCTSAWAAGTVTATRSAGTANKYNHRATVWRNHGGVGAIVNSGALTGAAPSQAITTTGANSAILMIYADFAARTVATRNYATINGAAGIEIDYFTNSANYTIAVAYWADAGAAGAKTVSVGTFSPTTTDSRMHIVEILGTGGGPAATSDLLIHPGRRLAPILAR